jgi:hypothetical protein
MEKEKPRKVISEDGMQDCSSLINGKEALIREKKDNLLVEKDKEKLRELEQEIRDLQLDCSLLNLQKMGLEQFQQQQGKQTAAVISEIHTAHERVKNLLSGVSDQVAKIDGMKKVLDENKKEFDAFKKNMETFVDTTYPAGESLNRWAHGGGLFLSLAGLVLGIACLVYAVNGAKDTKKQSNNTASLDLNFALGDLTRDPNEMSEDQLEEIMQKLIVDRGVIASGEVPQKRLWQNLAEVAEQTETGDQNLALVLLQEAASGIPGTSEFLWLDASQASNRYDALRAAYKKSKKLSDVYLAAAKIEYNGEEVPTFHTALLLQCALDRIHYDSLFPDIPTPAVA